MILGKKRLQGEADLSWGKGLKGSAGKGGGGRYVVGMQEAGFRLGLARPDSFPYALCCRERTRCTPLGLVSLCLTLEGVTEDRDCWLTQSAGPRQLEALTHVLSLESTFLLHLIPGTISRVQP